jgi:hypothetical protein
MKTRFSPISRRFCWMVFGLIVGGWAWAGRQDPKTTVLIERPDGFELVKKTTHTGTVPWTDTGLQVKEGEEFYFEGEGSVSLQKDNPVAVCGPEGLNMRTMQQPLPDQNLGCLVGRVVERTEIDEDKDRGEKTTRQFGPIFLIGRRVRIVMPASGRLFLGVNENLTKDNDGEFTVCIYKKSTSRPFDSAFR